MLSIHRSWKTNVLPATWPFPAASSHCWWWLQMQCMGYLSVTCAGWRYDNPAEQGALFRGALLRSRVKDDRQRFCTFYINNSQSAFYIEKPTCISWLDFKVSNYFRKLSESANPNVCLRCRLMTSPRGRIKICHSLFVSAEALSVIFGTLLAQFKYNDNVERWNWQSLGLFTAGLQPCRLL